MATIVTKNSSTASAVPTTSDLVQGELAVNVTDKRIFTENASTQIVELGTNPSTITTGSATVTGTLTANGTFASNNAVITGGSINSTPIGATTPSTVRGSTVTATTGFVGGLTGNVTGNLTGNVTGNVVGNLTGNVTGNVTASSGTTTLNNLVVNGTADFTNTKLTNITTPTLDSDAANKGYVDATVAAVIDSAPAALDTLNELAAALGDDANFSATVTTALATKLPLAGGTMTGAIAMGTSKITGLGDPTASQDAATKIYVDTADNLKLNLSGGTMSGAIAMGTNKITGLGDPTLAQDAATKAYTDSILGSATSAAASAAAAATSESNAATSASNAATSETNALNSANAAASSYDQFDDRYLGDKASDPTLDNDGNALLTGALYFNTTTDVMRVYTGSAWQDVAISTNSPTFTGTVTADGLSLGDNDKATFGNSNDLEIYHNGTNSYIDDTGTGSLWVRGNDVVLGKYTGEYYLYANADGALNLYYDGSKKLATTATGIDVTGTATMDGLTVDLGNTTDVNVNGTDGGGIQFSYGGVNQVRIDSASNDGGVYHTPAGKNHTFKTDGANRLKIATGGDISFYEDTGTTPQVVWDASADALTFGDNVKTTFGAGSDLQIYHDGSHSIIQDAGTGDLRLYGNNVKIKNADNTAAYIQAINGAEVSLFYNNAEKLSTTSTGIDVTGTVVSDGLTVDGDAVFSNGDGSVLVGDDFSKLQLKSLDSSTNSTGVMSEIADVALVNFDGGSNNHNLVIRTNDGLAATGTLRDRISIKSNGDISFYEDTGTTAKLFWDASAESLGIGTTSPDQLLHISASASPTIRIENTDTTATAGQTIGKIEFEGQDASTNASGVRALIDAQYAGVGGQGRLKFQLAQENSASLSDSLLLNYGTQQFFTSGSEAMRIDSSGNLLVGTTTTSLSTTEGINVGGNGELYVTKDGGSAIYAGRLTSDGDIIYLRKGATKVGSIGVEGGDSLYIVSGDTGLRFVGGVDSIVPSNANGAVRDAAIDLGFSSQRFKDLYLSGGAYLGGTGAANKLDDYEEGTFTPVVADASTGGNTATGTFTGSYTKIGKVVTARVSLININTSGMTGTNQLYIQGFPFTSDGLAQGIVTFNSIITTAVGGVTAYMASSTAARLSEKLSGAAQDFIDVQDLASGVSDINVTLIYEV